MPILTDCICARDCSPNLCRACAFFVRTINRMWCLVGVFGGRLLGKIKCIDSYVLLSRRGAQLKLSSETFYPAGSKGNPTMQ